MKLTALACCLTAVAAHPSSKVCTAGNNDNSNALGLPPGDVPWTAMGSTWNQVYDASSDIFQITDGALSLNVSSDNMGLFAIIDSGTIAVADGSGYSSVCGNGCDRLICIEGLDSGTVPVTVTNTNTDSCESINLVVGYAVHQAVDNVLQFATINACDSENIIVSTGTNPGSEAANGADFLGAAAGLTVAAIALSAQLF